MSTSAVASSPRVIVDSRYGYRRVDPLPSPEAFGLSRQAEALESAILGGREVADINRESQLARQSPGAQIKERVALFRQLRRIIHFLFTGQPSDRTELHTLRQGEGGMVQYQTLSGELSRYSPLISRLAGLLPQDMDFAERAA